ncbi:S8 family peptidase [Coleofasciculus sp.]|uniref:S8 family peptidase n=1 Tax=Coleofasciculus sp. TaxID=3100458 RepID=UPI003A287E43
MVDQSRDRPHIYLPDSGESENYTSPRTGTTPPPPPRDRERHANELARAIGRSLLKARQQLDSREPEIATGKPGFYLEFQVLTDQANAFEKLENRQKKIELVAVHKPAEQEDVVKATVFVPESATDYFLSKVEQYRDQETKKGKPKNEALVARLETVEIGTVRSLFTDDSTLFPQDEQEVWWEVWLRRDQRETFNTITERLNIQTKPHAISFPEREVVLAMADVEAMARLIKNSDAVAELRIAKDTPSMFLDMGPVEQVRWARDVADRILEPGQHAIALCLLDSGVTRTHPLIEPTLDSSDMHTYEPRWGVRDNWGHGTQMAGLALYADLLDVLQTSNQVKLRHRLESVKILQPNQPNEPELYGAITKEAVARPEIQAPNRRRVFCMAITSEIPASNQGTPSSWSAAIDQLCFGEDDWLKVTLSYFIEPNPGERGWGQRHRYASYSLRFEVKRPLESHDDFRRRINKAAREEEENTTTRTESDNWFLGSKLRNRGSIHSDIWYGTAIELAQRSAIAVYPVGGWWKDKKHLERWQQSAGYSLIVSIRVPEVEVDIYTPVLNRVKLAIDINT